MAWSSCIGVGNDRPDGLNVLFIPALANDFGTRLRWQDKRASLGPTVTENDAFSNQGRVTSLFVVSESVNADQLSSGMRVREGFE